MCVCVGGVCGGGVVGGWMVWGGVCICMWGESACVQCIYNNYGFFTVLYGV